MLSQLSRLDSKQQIKLKANIRKAENNNKIVKMDEVSQQFKEFDRKFEKAQEGSIGETSPCNESKNYTEKFTPTAPNAMCRLMTPLAKSFKILKTAES